MAGKNQLQYRHGTSLHHRMDHHVLNRSLSDSKAETFYGPRLDGFETDLVSAIDDPQSHRVKHLVSHNQP